MPPDDVLESKEKAKLFFTAHWKGFVCLIVPIILIPLVTPFPGEKHQWCAYTLCLMGIYWVTECIPLAITAFLPVMIFPMTGVATTNETCRAYINDSIMMFLGSIMLAYAVEQCGLHKRLAYCAIKAIGYSHYKLLLAMCIVTTFVSLWISNTATTTMMVPINFAILKVFEDQKILNMFDTNAEGEKVASDLTTCYFCAATFSATIGGIGTLVGTATNLVFKGLFMTAYPTAPEYLSFPLFSAFSIPMMILLEASTYLYLTIVYFGFLRPNSAAAKAAQITEKAKEAARNAIEEDCKRIGTITFWEIMVVLLFGGAMICFFCRSPQVFPGWGDKIAAHFGVESKFVRDSALAMLVTFLMFLLPSTLTFFQNWKAKFHEDLPKSRVSSVLDWPELRAHMPFSYMFLLGGGFALSMAAKSSGLNEKIGNYLQGLKVLPNFINLLLIIIVVVFVTNFASNVAVCNVFAPIAMQLAKEINQNPLWYDIAAGFAASYCFMIPVGTPGNLIVQSAVNMPMQKMIKAGFGPTVSTVIISWLCIYFWGPVIWPDLHQMPKWIKDAKP
ncbi:protein I'm not dead yet-like [Bombyx mandarina]|uniref:Protein I'm not dead yet n=2 Tax=Bombyx TaxID=7090 RepID=A0A8R1WJ64_BOMMO|nr:protein I'm not dead yet [Bombyx mori]XP_028044050.1 protein I'm not dead yet-like [Bombyx mandarina]